MKKETLEEAAEQFEYTNGIYGFKEGVKWQAKRMYSKDDMIEFAKLHVKAALKEASEKATVTPIDYEEISEGSFRPIWGVDDDSILNSYSLDNIK